MGKALIALIIILIIIAAIVWAIKAGWSIMGAGKRQFEYDEAAELIEARKQYDDAVLRSEQRTPTG